MYTYTCVKTEAPSLWDLTFGAPHIDPDDLADAVARELDPGVLHAADHRTRLLLRDALVALRSRWGEDRFGEWVAHSTSRRDAAGAVLAEPFERIGFPSIGQRLMNATRRDTVLAFLRELGQSLPGSARIDVGGSTALILRDLLSRQTEDVDVVDEIPAAIRSEHDLLNGLVARYGLRLTHFQSHYLPDGWQSRTSSLGRFGKLDVFLVDPLDIVVGKLFSARAKDLDDVRMLSARLDRNAVIQRLQASAGRLASDSALRTAAERNWYVVYGEPLPAITGP